MRKVPLIIMGLLVFSALVLGTRDQIAELAEKRAQLLQNGVRSAEVLFSVGGLPVTQGEYLATIEEVKFNMANMASMNTSVAKARLAVMAKYPPELIAFAALLETTGLLAKAKEEGVTVPAEDIAEQVSETRRLYREGNITALQQLVKIYGEKPYFEEILPRLYERDMTVGRYVARALGNVPDEARDEARRDLVQRVLANARVTVSVANPALDVPRAMQYLAEYWSAQ